MEGEPKPPVLVRVTQYAFLFFAMINALGLVMAGPDIQGLVICFLLVIAATQIGKRSKYARGIVIAGCIFMILRSANAIYLYSSFPDENFKLLSKPVALAGGVAWMIMYIAVAAYFAFSPKVVYYFHPELQPRFPDPPPPPSFDT